MNILIIDTNIVEKKIIELCLKSKFLDKIYTASQESIENIPNVEYKDLSELIWKAKALKIDLAIVTDKNLIRQGIADLFKKNLLNILAVNRKWFNLENSRLVAKQLMEYYSINHPQTIKAPLVFPIVIKTDKPEITKVAKSMKDLIAIKEKYSQKNTFIEEYLAGDVYYLLSLWDGKNLLKFPLIQELTEVQEDRLELLNTKLGIMFSEEKADFIGFITTKIIWSKNDWHVLDFSMRINKKADINILKSDFLFILNSAIYQKLNEMVF